MRRCLIVLLALSIPAAKGLSAQLPAERAAIEALRDSLAHVTDSLSLKRLEAATIQVAKQHRDDPLVHVRLGFIAHRLGEIANTKSHYDDAAGEFEWAAELRPGWPYPWYGLGLAELAQGEHAVIAIENLRQQLGKDYLSKAARALARATQADASFAQASIDLANAALAQRIQPRLEVALQAVRLAAASPAGGNAQIQLARGRVEREVGEADSALVAFQAYLRVGGDSGLGLLELARTYYYAQRPTEGWRIYFAGARLARSPEALALYRADLSVVAHHDELAPFDGFTSPAPRAAWLERFWLQRDVAEARDPGERLAEHYRRWFYAWHNFRLVSRHRHYDITERYRTDQLDFDDRGVIYLRHGREDVQDYKLVESLADALYTGFRGALALTGRRGLDPLTSDLFASRADINPLYARLGNTLGSANAAGVLAAERSLGQRSITVGTTTDSYRRTFTTPLEVLASDFVVGARGHTGQELHVVFAIPGQRLTPAGDSTRVLYPVAFRLVVSDSLDNLVARLDTTRVFAAAAPLRQGAYLTGQVALAVPPGAYRYRLLVQEPGSDAGDLVIRDSIAVGTLDGARFAASDLVLGRQGSGLAWTTGSDTVPLNPLGRFAEGGSAELYYEVYGLASGAPYHTIVRLERDRRRSLFHRLFGGGQAPVLFEFDAPADGPVTRVRRALDLRDASKGSYVLAVEIRDPATATSLVRRRQFVIVSR